MPLTDGTGFGFGGAHLQAHALAMPRREQAVDDVEPLRARRPVAGGHVGAEVERGLRRVAQEAADLEQLRRGHDDRPVADVEADLLTAPGTAACSAVMNAGISAPAGGGGSVGPEGGAGFVSCAAAAAGFAARPAGRGLRCGAGAAGFGGRRRRLRGSRAAAPLVRRLVPSAPLRRRRRVNRYATLRP